LQPPDTARRRRLSPADRSGDDRTASLPDAGIAGREGEQLSAFAGAVADGRVGDRLWLYATYHCNLACS